VLMVLLFSKTFYTASIGSYYTFFLMQKFGVSTQASQIYLFLFLGASAVGVFFGGPLGDRFGRKYVIWFSIIGALPFTLALPYVDLYWNAVLSIVIGFIISSATPAIIVYAQELMPHRLGMISGLFYGMAFGFGGIGAAVLGQVGQQVIHRWIVGRVIDKATRLISADQAGNGQFFQMKRKATVCLSSKAFSNGPHRKALGARLDEQSKDLEAGFLRQRAKGSNCFFDYHVSILIEAWK